MCRNEFIYIGALHQLERSRRSYFIKTAREENKLIHIVFINIQQEGGRGGEEVEGDSATQKKYKV